MEFWILTILKYGFLNTIKHLHFHHKKKSPYYELRRKLEELGN